MKATINKEKLKSSLLLCVFLLFFNILFSTAIFLLIWYWAIPNICIMFSTFKTHLESLSIESAAVVKDTFFCIGAYIAIFPSAIIACRLSKKRKKEFFDYSKGRSSYIDGLKYYIARYGIYDTVCISITIVLSVILYAFAGNMLVAKFFPTAYYMFEKLGLILGLVVMLLSTNLSMLCGVFFSQKKWRAEYFFGE